MKPGTKVRIITFHPNDARATNPEDDYIGEIVETRPGFKKHEDYPYKGWYIGRTSNPFNLIDLLHKAVWIEEVKDDFPSN